MEWFIPEWLVALALTLFILDIFLMTEILSWGGVFSLAVWLTWKIDASWKWMVLVFVASFTMFAFMYWFLFRNVIGRFVRRIMQGKSQDEALYSLKGKTGRIKNIDGKSFVFVDGELWPVIYNLATLPDGAIVKVKCVERGELKVEEL